MFVSDESLEREYNKYFKQERSYNNDRFEKNESGRTIEKRCKPEFQIVNLNGT